MTNDHRLPTIELATGDPHELATRELLLGILGRYDLDRWCFTDQVRIERGVVPHSHPVLTINTRYGPDQEHELIATYIHEQLHWFWSRADHRDRVAVVMEELSTRYPGLPVGPPDGCKSAFSNTLHIGINTLELLAMESLIGLTAATDLILAWPFYRAVYALVVRERDAVLALLQEHDLLPPEVPPVLPA